MATRFVGTPESAHFPASNFAALGISNRRPVLMFDAATSETAYWTFVAPQGWTGAVTAVISYAMASATSGSLSFDVALEAITTGDATDTDAATSFATVNTGTDAGVPGTAGYMEQLSITLSNDDSTAAADLVRVSVARNISDTATGDAYLFAIELRDAA